MKGFAGCLSAAAFNHAVCKVCLHLKFQKPGQKIQDNTTQKSLKHRKYRVTSPTPRRQSFPTILQ